ncbi:MAG: VWA domain-containing protein [Chloroflexi bacterium]|nr:VWA domain-containing protein [Chloroflexota bacterium]
MLNRKWLIGFVLLALVCISGCASPTAAAKAIARQEINSGQIVPAEELRVAEYLQYYQQNFPQPVNTTLGLDLRLGNTQVPVDGGTAWLQIGIQAKDAAATEIAPLNLALVIDRSGSMDSPEKMPYLKQSLRVFLQSLASNDIVSIVAFSDNAELIVPANKVGNGAWIENAINRIQPGGSTNLYDGLMMGFKQVDRNFDVRRNNRVFLLTDGMANVGVTDPKRIAADAKAYNDKGIYLSSVGLGKDFNDPLLNTLAQQGKAGYHYIDSAEEMDKVFRQEVTGMMQSAANDVLVTISPAAGVNIDSVTGYDGRPPAGTFQVRMQNMGTGNSQVLLVKLFVSSGLSGVRPIAKVDLSYKDLFSQRTETLSSSVTATSTRLGNYDPTWDVEILRNVTIQRTAEGLKQIDSLYKAQRYQEAWNLAVQLEQDLRTAARLTNDPQMTKDADLMRTYQDTLAKWVQRQTGRSPQYPESGGNRGDTGQPTLPGRQLLPTQTPPVINIK